MACKIHGETGPKGCERCLEFGVSDAKSLQDFGPLQDRIQELVRLRDADLTLRQIVEAIPAEWYDENTAPLALVQELVADLRRKTQLLLTLATDGGCIVASADCSEHEIVDARARGDFYVDANGLGWVRRLPEWLGRHSRYARGVGPDCCERWA